MKVTCLIIILIITGLLSCSPPSQPTNLTLTITCQTTAETPVSPLLHSHFIEIGFGYQIAPGVENRGIIVVMNTTAGLLLRAILGIPPLSLIPPPIL